MMTKRQLGKLCAGVGLLAALVILALDVLFPGREGGFGPGQIAALLISIALFLLGMSLLPLGDDPA
ncbi:MAG: hypothetical protein OXF22_04445 [Anaerolineaceae bacterium]|nr:hypothetical protein [Anaerolineaceae bacterium]